MVRIKDFRCTMVYIINYGCDTFLYFCNCIKSLSPETIRVLPLSNCNEFNPIGVFPDESVPLSVPSIKGNEWQYVKECIDTEWVSSAGKYVNLFEEKIAEYTGSRFAVACVNGTAALQMSLRLVGVQPQDEVIVPTLTFIAPVNAIAYNGGEPVFMDVDEYYNIDYEKTIEFIKHETVFRHGEEDLSQ